MSLLQLFNSARKLKRLLQKKNDSNENRPRINVLNAYMDPKFFRNMGKKRKQMEGKKFFIKKEK